MQRGIHMEKNQKVDHTKFTVVLHIVLRKIQKKFQNKVNVKTKKS